MELIFILLALAAAGTLAILTVKFTMPWLKNRILNSRRSINAKRHYIAALDQQIQNCTNQKKLSDLLNARQQGVTHIFADLDENNKIIDYEFYHNESIDYDLEVTELIGTTGEVILEV